MEVVYRRCCGIDVHKKSVTVCVWPPVGRPEVGGECPVDRRKQRLSARSLDRLRAVFFCREKESRYEETIPN